MTLMTANVKFHVKNVRWYADTCLQYLLINYLLIILNCTPGVFLAQNGPAYC